MKGINEFIFKLKEKLSNGNTIQWLAEAIEVSSKKTYQWKLIV